MMLKEELITPATIEEDYNTLRQLIRSLKVDTFESSFLKKLQAHFYLVGNVFSSYLEDKNLELEKDLFCQLLKTINNSGASPRTNKNFQDLNSSIHRLFIEKKPTLKSEIDYFFNKAIFSQEVNSKDEMKIKKEKSLLNELSTKGKNVYPTVRRLIINISEQKVIVRLPDVTEQLKELSGHLPEAELTPLVCQSLMKFHSRHTRDIEQAVYWYEMMTAKIINQFEISKYSFLQFVVVNFFEFFFIN